jgi:hypothetical protein
MNTRDILWLNVNGHAILNIYRDITIDLVLDYVTNLKPLAKCFVSGDFNVYHDIFEPRVEPAYKGHELAK